MFRWQRNERCGSLRRADDLAVRGEGKDVVANHIVAAVMLVEAAVVGAIDDVVLPKDVGAALVGIQSPAAVAEGHTSWTRLLHTRVPGEMPNV